jgi:hypothetical protein
VALEILLTLIALLFGWLAVISHGVIRKVLYLAVFAVCVFLVVSAPGLIVLV